MLYVRKTNDVITGGEKARATVVLAFEFAANKVGIDLDSYDLWKDYIDFYKSWTPGSNYELQQKNDLIRKLYKRCLVIPNAKLETMWADYRKWENEVSSPNSASKFIADLSTAYMEVRPWNTEWHNATEGLLRRKLVPYSPYDDSSDIVLLQVSLWFRWIDLEKKNKLSLPEAALSQRIEYVYRRAISTLPFVPEIWFRLSEYLLSIDEEANRSACVSLLADGLVLNPSSYILAFRVSELYEKDNLFFKAREVFENIIRVLSEQYLEIESSISKLKAEAVEASNLPPKEIDHENGYDSNEDDVPSTPIYAYTESQAGEIKRLNKKLDDLGRCVTLLYIKLMSLCKRSQGIKEVRAVFKQRKNFKAMGFEFYVENALHEYYSDNKKTADKVFDLAMKSFNKNAGFLYAYLNYLILSNSIESLKVIFEVAVTSLLKEIAVDKEKLEISTTNLVIHDESLIRLKRNNYYMKKIIKRYISFAASYLDLNTVLSLNKRFIQYFPDTDSLTLFADRYKLGGLNLIVKYDLAGVDADTDDFSDCEENDGPQQKRRKVMDVKATEKTMLPVRPDGLPLPPTPSITAGSQSQQPQQERGFVGKEIFTLLQFLPNAGYFGPKNEHLFNSTKLVELFTHAVLPGEQ